MNDTKATDTKPDSAVPFSLTAWVPLIGFLLMAIVAGILLKHVVNVYVVKEVLTFAKLSACLIWAISVLFFAGSILVTFGTAFQVIKEELSLINLWIGCVALFIGAGVITWVLLPGGSPLNLTKICLGTFTALFHMPKLL